MTRNSVSVDGKGVVADVFHDHDSDDPHATIEVDGRTVSFSDSNNYLDIDLFAYQQDIETIRKYDDEGRMVAVYENDERVWTGLLEDNRGHPVSIQFGGYPRLDVANDQMVTIRLIGKPADA